MNKLLTAIALTIALPAVAHAAEPAPAPGAKQDCCEKMKAEGKECCKDMDHKAHAKQGDHDSDAGGHEAHQR
jgi:hypothetical protein